MTSAYLNENGANAKIPIEPNKTGSKYFLKLING